MSNLLNKYYPIVLLIFSPLLVVGQHQFQRGLIWEDNRYNALPVSYPTTLNLPPSKDLRAFYPKVVIESRQDFTGVAWATVWNARTAAEAIACNETDPKGVLQMAFAPAYNYALIRKGEECSEKVSMIDMLESMVKNGSLSFSEFGEFCAVSAPSEMFSLAKSKRLSGYLKLFNTTDNREIKVQSVKQAVATNNAVVIGLICPPSFQLAGEFWQPREQPDPQYGGHALSVVGYDDTKFGGAFEVINSWGKDWGTSGFTWLRYKDFADYVLYAFSLFQVGSASCNSPLEGSVSFRLPTGQELNVTKEPSEGEYRIAQTLTTGAQFVININSNRPVFFYAYGIDPGGNYFQAFPETEAVQPILFGHLRIPSGSDFIKLTEPAGLNQLYFLFSPRKVDLQDFSGSHRGASKPELAEAEWQTNSAGFSSKMNEPVLVRILLDQK